MIGTGLGCSYRDFNQNILSGMTGGACEIGQVIYKEGLLEDYVSTKSLVELARNKYSLDVNDGKEFFKLFQTKNDVIQSDFIYPKLNEKLNLKINNIYVKNLNIIFPEQEKYSIFKGLINYHSQKKNIN